jgi:hypothetical protein
MGLVGINVDIRRGVRIRAFSSKRGVKCASVIQGATTKG